jgi:AraC-like DNA-binding protein
MKMAIHAVAPGWWHGIVPLDCGYEKCVPNHAFGPAVRPYYLLHYVLEGAGTFLKNGTLHKVLPGDLFVICPEELTTYRANQENPWEYCWVSFRAEGTPEFLKEPVIRQPQVRQIFEQIRDQVQGEPEDGKIFTLLYEMLWRLSLDVPLKQDRQNTYALYAKTYLETAYMRQVSIQEIADTLHIDRRYLTILFRETYGKPTQAYLMQLRLEQARNFLNQGFGVAEAASMSGFSDLSNFSRQYKRTFGICPSRQK